MDIRVACEHACVSRKTLLKNMRTEQIFENLSDGKWLVDKLSIGGFSLEDLVQLDAIKLKILEGLR